MQKVVRQAGDTATEVWTQNTGERHGWIGAYLQNARSHDYL